MARPKIPTESLRVVTAIRLRPKTRLAIQKAAGGEGRSMTNLVERIVEEWLKEKGLLK